MRCSLSAARGGHDGPVPPGHDDGHGEVGTGGDGRRDGQRVRQPAVRQQPAVEDDGRHEAGERGGRPDRRRHRPVLEPALLAGLEVGGHRGERDRQVLDAGVAEDVGHPGEDLLRADGAGRPRRGVVEPQHVAMGEAAHPVGVRVETARGEQAADHGAPIELPAMLTTLVPALAQDLEDADVGVPAGSASHRAPRRRGAGGRLSPRPGHAATLLRRSGWDVTPSRMTGRRQEPSVPASRLGDAARRRHSRRGNGRPRDIAPDRAG